MRRFQRLFPPPVILLAPPVLVLALMGARALETERLAARASVNDTIARELVILGETVEATITDLARSALNRVAAAAPAVTGSVATLHTMVTKGDPPFAAVHEGDRRAFPPEDSGAILASEARWLERLAGALAVTRARAATESIAWAWVEGEQGGALACQRLATNGIDLNTDHCALIDGEKVRRVISQTLARAGAAAIGVMPPHDTAALGATAGIERALSGPLAGWRLVADAGNAPASSGAWASHVAIAIALLGLWGALVHRVERDRVAANLRARERVEAAARLAHDLRTPLANLRLHVDLIRRRANDPERIAGHTEVLNREIDRIAVITEIGIALARGDGGDSVTIAAIDPPAFLGELAARVAPRALAARSTVSVEDTVSMEGAGTFPVNVVAVERMVFNLLDNALTHAPGAAVDMGARIDGDRLLIWVRDHGPGRGGGDPDARGAGLGLEITRRLAAAHGGGRLWLEDARPGTRAKLELGKPMSTPRS